MWDQKRKKKDGGNKGNGGFTPTDLSAEKPEVDDTLADLDRAIKQAQKPEKKERTIFDRCGC